MADDLREALDELKAEIAELRRRVEVAESRSAIHVDTFYQRSSPYQPNVWCGLHKEPIG